VRPASDFDDSISIRTAVLGALIGCLSQKWTHIDPALLALIGCVGGALYDRIAYECKTRWPWLFAGPDLGD